MLQPKRTKFRKQQKGRNRGLAQRGGKVSFGDYALKSVSRGRMTSRQIEAARRAITRYVSRGGMIFPAVFVDADGFLCEACRQSDFRHKPYVATGLRHLV